MLINYGECCKLFFTLYGMHPKNILHVGAHVGEEYKQYHKYGARKIIWVEANYNLIPQLKKNIGKFTFRKITQQIISTALFDQNIEIQFNLTNDTQCSSIFELGDHLSYYPNIKKIDSIKLTTERLDEIFKFKSDIIFNDPDFINIDTQGSELNILRGCGDLLYNQSLRGIYIEVNKEYLYKDIHLVDEIDNYLSSFGFVRLITNWTSNGWGDALYLRQKEIV